MPEGTVSQVRTSSEVGDVIGGYRLKTVLGRGGMGCVYLATHKVLGRRAAIKVLSPSLASDEEFASVSSEIDPVVPNYAMQIERKDWLAQKWSELIVAG